jgi:hypothetical protein
VRLSSEPSGDVVCSEVVSLVAPSESLDSPLVASSESLDRSLLVLPEPLEGRLVLPSSLDSSLENPVANESVLASLLPAIVSPPKVASESVVAAPIGEPP